MAPTRDPDVIRHDIERTREEIAESLATLRTSVTEAADWRTYVRRQPLAYIGGAFALGLLLGLK
jgi:ElaB/YqjD/DUF883 family membrane-anchored ribosome-binding protein